MSTFSSLREAARYAGVSYYTIREWARSYGIGEIVDGRWHVNREKLDSYMAARESFAAVKDQLRKSA